MYQTMPGTGSCAQLVWLMCVWKDSSACTLCGVCALPEEHNPTAASLFQQASPGCPVRSLRRQCTFQLQAKAVVCIVRLLSKDLVLHDT